MSPRSDTWMPLYVADYLKDTRHLSGCEHGAYLLLLMHAWTNDGTIPRDDVRLARIACMSPREWRSVRSAVLEFWIDLSEHSGLYMHRRVNAELARAQANIEQRRAAGKASAQARNRQRKSNDRSTTVDDPLQRNRRPSPSPKNPPLAPQGAEPLGEHVDAIWEDTPAEARKRSSRKDLETALKAAVGRGGDPAAIRQALKAYYRSDQASKENYAYAKGVHRMVANDRWREWIGVPGRESGPPKADWPARVAAHRRSGMWLELQWGPPPGDPQCRCPAEFLGEPA